MGDKIIVEEGEFTFLVMPDNKKNKDLVYIKNSSFKNYKNVKIAFKKNKLKIKLKNKNNYITDFNFKFKIGYNIKSYFKLNCTLVGEVLVIEIKYNKDNEDNGD